MLVGNGEWRAASSIVAIRRCPPGLRIAVKFVMIWRRRRWECMNPGLVFLRGTGSALRTMMMMEVFTVDEVQCTVPWWNGGNDVQIAGRQGTVPSLWLCKLVSDP